MRNFDKASIERDGLPGNPKAVKLGCTCQQNQNSVGLHVSFVGGGPMGIPITESGERIYFANPNCPIHTTENRSSGEGE